MKMQSSHPKSLRCDECQRDFGSMTKQGGIESRSTTRESDIKGDLLKLDFIGSSVSYGTSLQLSQGPSEGTTGQGSRTSQVDKRRKSNMYEVKNTEMK